MRPATIVSQCLPIAACLGGGSLYGWSGYVPAVMARFETDHAGSSIVFSFALASFTVGVLFGPILVARLPGWLRLSALSTIAALSLMAGSLSAGFTTFLLAYGIGFGAASGMLYSYAISEASRSALPTLLVPMSVAAFGLGGAIFGPWAAWLGEDDWTLWANFPAQICLGVIAVMALIFARDGTDTAPDTIRFTAPDRRTAKLWVIFAAGSFTGLVVLGLAGQIVAHSSTDATSIGLAVFLVATGNTLGRLAAALTAPAIGPARAIAAALIFSLLSVALIIFTTSATYLLALLFIVALAYGHVAANMPLLVRTQVSKESFPSTFGWVFTGWGFAGFAAPWAAGALLDATLSFAPILVACFGITVISLVLVTGYFSQDRLGPASHTGDHP